MPYIWTWLSWILLNSFSDKQSQRIVKWRYLYFNYVLAHNNYNQAALPSVIMIAFTLYMHRPILKSLKSTISRICLWDAWLKTTSTTSKLFLGTCMFLYLRLVLLAAHYIYVKRAGRHLRICGPKRRIAFHINYICRNKLPLLWDVVVGGKFFTEQR